MNDDNQSHDSEKLSIMDICNKGKLMCSIFSHALLIEVTYRFVQDTTSSSSDLSLEGIVGNDDNARSYIMPHDDLIIEKLQELPSDQCRQLTYEYQIALLPDGAVGYYEKSVKTGKARIFRTHPGLSQIFYDICILESGIQLKPDVKIFVNCPP